MAKAMNGMFNPPGAPPSPPPTPAGAKATTPTNKVPALGKITPRFRAPKIVVNAVEGWGKTSMSAYSPNPAILQARGETGYETLLGVGLAPQVDSARIETWQECLALLDDMIANKDTHQVIALDAMGGFERLCHELVCARDYGGDWGEHGFVSFQKGYDTSITEWLKLLQRLEKLNDAGAIILLLSHCRVKTFKNPMGSDYDRYASDVHDKTWSATSKWADAVLFGNFLTIVDTGKKEDVNKKGKGIGSDKRVVWTTRRDAFDAKNRYSLPDRIDIPDDHPELIWSTIYSHIRKETANAV